jgi:hypothetical protein
MPPKKAAKKAEGDADLWEEFKKRLRKNEQEFETPKIPAVQDIMRKMDEEGVCPKWIFDTEFDPMAFRILFHSLAQAKYLDISAIWVWKCNGGDESVRSVCYYLDQDPKPNVKDLQFIDNGVTALGCEFLARTLGPNGNPTIDLLRLDFNQFGTPGIEKLSMGLSQNATLRYLSLQYCNIGEDGGRYIAHILMFYRNALESLFLRGNYLGNAGVVDLLVGARRTKVLKEIDLYDNKFTDSQELIQALRDLFANNTALTKYDLSGNKITDAGAYHLVNGMIGHNHFKSSEAKVLVTEQVSTKTWEALQEVTTGKGKKGKKGKK